MTPLLLLLLDSRAPAGGHAHSGGMEAAVTAGMVRDIGDVEAFCRGRLRTSGRVAASFAAASCRLTLGPAAGSGAACRPATGPRLGWDGSDGWDVLEAELEARTPSEAARAASRQLGSGLRRMVRSMFPDVALPWPQSPAPHHPLMLGCAVALAGGDPHLAAQAALLASITAPASAAVRLLGLDPLAVQGMLARLAADRGSFPPAEVGKEPRSWAADGAPYLDLLADVHRTAEVRLFAS